MTEGLQGAIIGGLIGIAGSMVVEMFRSKRQKEENSRRYQSEIYEKRKATYFEILEHFRRFEISMRSWGSDPNGKTDLMNPWNSLTGYRSHLSFLPDSVSGPIKIGADRLYDVVLASQTAKLDGPILRNDIIHDAAELIRDITFCIESDIITMHIKLLRPMGPWGKWIEKIKDIIHKQPKERGS